MTCGIGLKALKKDIKDQHHKHQQKNGPLQASFTSRFGGTSCTVEGFFTSQHNFVLDSVG